MVNVIGTEIPIDINFSGFISNTWWWVLIVVILVVILSIGTGFLLFFRTYNRKIEIYENIAGRGYQRTGIVRARIVKMGNTGGEVLRTWRGNFLSAYGNKIGTNTYMYVRGPDGYYYNAVHGDFDTKLGILDIEPVDTDVRMFHDAVAKYIGNQYGETNKLAQLIMYGIPVFLLIILLVGGYVLIGKIGEVTSPLAETNKNSAEIVKSNAQITERISLIVERLEGKQISLDPDVVNTGLISGGT